MSDANNICARCKEQKNAFRITVKKDDSGKYKTEQVCYKCLNEYNPPRSWRQYSNPSNKEKV